MIDPSLRRAAGFLARFLCIIVVFFLLWSFLSPLYLSSLALVHNAVAGPAAAFAVYGGSLAVVYHGMQPDPIVLQLTRNDVFYMNLLVAPALLMATPVGSVGRRVAWIAAVAVLVWLGHLSSLQFGRYLVIWDFVESLEAAQAGALTPKVEAEFPRATEEVARAVFDRWRVWGRPTLALVVWFYVAGDYLRFGGADAGAGMARKP